MHWDPGKLRAHDRVAVSEAVANESVSQTGLAVCVARQVYELALVAASRASRYALPEGDYDDVVCLSPPPTRSARATEAPHEPWTAKTSTARARSVAAAAAPWTAARTSTACSTRSSPSTSAASACPSGRP
jgi:hypothetical protein